VNKEIGLGVNSLEPIG